MEETVPILKPGTMRFLDVKGTIRGYLEQSQTDLDWTASFHVEIPEEAVADPPSSPWRAGERGVLYIQYAAGFTDQRTDPWSAGIPLHEAVLISIEGPHPLFNVLPPAGHQTVYATFRVPKAQGTT